jgi:hypothetical protein
MPPASPLPTLFSQALVAFTIEFDNEAEHRMPHRTTRHSASPGAQTGPWLVSMVMWLNCMRYVTDDGITVSELAWLARTETNLPGMLRWGYLSLEPNPSARSKKASFQTGILRCTPRGKKAQEIWRPLGAEIEARWHERFGAKAIAELRDALAALESQFSISLPDCMPILHYGLVSWHASSESLTNPRAPESALGEVPLSALLARVLLAFAIDFERESHLSLAICANVLRVLSEKGERARDLPLVSGVSKESIAMAMGILRKGRCAEVGTEKLDGRAKVIRLTLRGLEAQKGSRELVANIEKRWRTRYGERVLAALREALEPIVGDGTAQNSPLFRGLEPHPENWRAAVARPRTLPHFPMVSHRGGYPDGA